MKNRYKKIFGEITPEGVYLLYGFKYELVNLKIIVDIYLN
jgi:hypothetical protein